MVKPLLNWVVTNWLMKGTGEWKLQPVILIEGQPPFYADCPGAYISKLEAMVSDPTLEPGDFFTSIGQLKDGLEQHWKVSDGEQIGR